MGNLGKLIVAKGFKKWPKCKKSPNLVTLLTTKSAPDHLFLYIYAILVNTSHLRKVDRERYRTKAKVNKVRGWDSVIVLTRHDVKFTEAPWRHSWSVKSRNYYNEASNPRSQNGRRRRNQGAMSAARRKDVWRSRFDRCQNWHETPRRGITRVTKNYERKKAGGSITRSFGRNRSPIFTFKCSHYFTVYSIRCCISWSYKCNWAVNRSQVSFFLGNSFFIFLVTTFTYFIFVIAPNHPFK